MELFIETSEPKLASHVPFIILTAAETALWIDQEETRIPLHIEAIRLCFPLWEKGRASVMVFTDDYQILTTIEEYHRELLT